MKLQKRIVMMLSVLLFAFIMIACDDTTTLTEFRFEGIEDALEIEFDSEFNILTGVKAIGNDEKDYSENITFTTTSKAIAEDGTLDTKVPGNSLVRYEIKEGDVRLQQWRTLTVKEPEREGDALVQNGDFSLGTSYWTVDQGTIEMTIEDDAAKLDLVAGAEAHEPRMYQMNIPFEEGKTYEISFEGKASVLKTINLQVGELLSDAPWFEDFKKRQVETADLTLEWDSFSYTFRHTLENDRGGILFEFGTVAGQTIDGTVWLRNIEAKEVEAEEDTKAPEFEGVNDAVLTLGTPFDPLAGVSAHDLFDGDVTEDITFEIKNADDEEVTTINVGVVGTYTITYTVSDEAGNKATATRTVTFEEMTFKDENLIVNGDFSQALGTEWGSYTEGGGAFTFEIVDGNLELDVTSLGSNPWDVQFFQEGFKLELGKTYRVSFTASATVERDVNLAVGLALDQAPYFTDYLPKQTDLTIGVESTTHTFIFTVSQETIEAGKLVLELGNTTNGKAGKVTVESITLQERDVAELITSDFTSEKHVVEQADGVTHAQDTRTANELTIEVLSTGGEAYIPHYLYELARLDAGTYVYKISVTSDVTRHLRFNIVLPDSDFNSILPPVEEGSEQRYVDFEVKAGVKYEFEVEFVATVPLEETVKVELDFGPIGYDGETLLGKFVLEDVLLYRK